MDKVVAFGYDGCFFARFADARTKERIGLLHRLPRTAVTAGPLLVDRRAFVDQVDCRVKTFFDRVIIVRRHAAPQKLKS
jgi:hypothetical protein